MYYPQIEDNSTTRQMLSVFRGYNHNPIISEGEFFDMLNMSSDNYPLLSPRKKRTCTRLEDSELITASDKLIRVEYLESSQGVGACDVHYGEKTYSFTLNEAPTDVICTGAYIVLLPSWKYINTADGKSGDLHAHGYLKSFTDYGAMDMGMIISNCERDGTDLVYAADPTEPNIGEYTTEAPQYKYDDQNNEPIAVIKPPRLKKYVKVDEETAKWVDVSDTYVSIRIEHGGGDDDAIKADWTGSFKDGDYVNLSGFKTIWGTVDGIDAYGKTQWVKDSIRYYLPWLNGNHHIEKITDDGGIVISGLAVSTKDGDTASAIIDMSDPGNAPTVAISLIFPELDYVIACGNRLWGCRYGPNSASGASTVNEIYATMLGDISRWHTYADGSPSDNSWAASINVPGLFTGAAVLDGRPYFFKENNAFAIFGTDTTEYNVACLDVKGVQSGCSKSIATLDGMLYYKSYEGIVAFDGTSAQLISSALGQRRFDNAIAGACGGKYYVSMSLQGERHLFVFDTRYGLWYVEDDPGTKAFTFAEGSLLCVTDDGLMYVIDEDNGDEVVRWFAESGIIGLDSPDRKYISRISIRMSLAPGSKVIVSAQYDSTGDFTRLYGTESQTFTTFTIPVPLRRHDHMRLRIEGEGDVKIYSITKTIEEGSDM